MPHAYTEELLVELPAFEMFANLGWATVSALDETFGLGGTLGREMSGEVVLLTRLRPALVKLNPKLPSADERPEVKKVVRELLTRLKVFQAALILRNQFRHEFAMDIGQPEIAALKTIRQLLVVETH